MKRTLVVIDGNNCHATCRAAGLVMDWNNLKSFFKRSVDVVRFSYFMATPEADADGHEPVRKLLDWLDYNGYHLVTRPQKSFAQESGERINKGDMDADIIASTLEAIHNDPTIREVVLFTGDSDFIPMIKVLQRWGVRVTVISSINERSKMCSDTLRRCADEFLDYFDLKDQIFKPPLDYTS